MAKNFRVPLSSSSRTMRYGRNVFHETYVQTMLPTVALSIGWTPKKMSRPGERRRGGHAVRDGTRASVGNRAAFTPDAVVIPRKLYTNIMVKSRENSGIIFGVPAPESEAVPERSTSRTRF